MAWTTPVTAVTGTVATAGDWNTSVRDNLNFLASSASDTIATAQTTTSTTYTDLATVGPTATLETRGSALVTVTARISANVIDSGYMGFAVSGASVRAATDSQSLNLSSSGAGHVNRASASFTVTGLTPGSHTFTAKYRQNGASTGTYADRSIIVLPL